MKKSLSGLSVCLLLVFYLIPFHSRAGARVINVREFPSPELGAAGDLSRNATPAIRAAMLAAMREGKEVFIPAGEYLIDGQMGLSLDGDLTVTGEGDRTVLVFARENSIRVSGSRLLARVELSEDAPRNSDTVSIGRAEVLENIKPGDRASFISTKLAERAWRTPAQHLSRIAAVDVEKGVILLEHPLNFSFNTEDEARVDILRTSGKLTMKNLVFTVPEDAGDIRRPEPLGLSGLDGAVLENIRVHGDDAFRVGFTVASSIDSEFKNLYFELPRYAVTAGNSRNIKFENVECNNARHAIAPGGWSDGIYVDGLRGRNNAGIVDAHPSFNVHFNNVHAENERGMSNLRSVGGSITNSRFVSISDSDRPPLFQTLVLATPEIYQDYELLIENVYWKGPHPITIRNIGRAVFRNVECYNLEGEPVGINSAESVGELILSNTKPGDIRTHRVRLEE